MDVGSVVLWGREMSNSERSYLVLADAVTSRDMQLSTRGLPFKNYSDLVMCKMRSIHT